MNKTIHSLLVLALLAVCATGCVTQKQMTYLRDADPARAEQLNATFTPQSEFVIRQGDALTIFVSALDQEAVVPYNLPTVVYATPGTEKLQTTPALQYYTVDANGDIEMPVLGKIHLAGLKESEAVDTLKARLSQQVLNPMVQLHLVNAKVAVMGEVARPGTVPLSNGRLTILEALAAAGDMTSYGRRDNVLITRECNGKIEMQRVDLHSADLVNSPYYYLQQNDVIYVSPNKVRAISSTNVSLWLSMVSTVASAATVIVTVVNAANK
ncbi:MAG: polysaccharide biosynthesis/export family protein [Paludibacteraceae bacterium]|nr:polysaccharide biosynthesis/export family protein [Paludibacteraceae bacterium]